MHRNRRTGYDIRVGPAPSRIAYGMADRELGRPILGPVATDVIGAGAKQRVKQCRSSWFDATVEVINPASRIVRHRPVHFYLFRIDASGARIWRHDNSTDLAWTSAERLRTS